MFMSTPFDLSTSQIFNQKVVKSGIVGEHMHHKHFIDGGGALSLLCLHLAAKDRVRQRQDGQTMQLRGGGRHAILCLSTMQW
jgi:hypothetical protein